MYLWWPWLFCFLIFSLISIVFFAYSLTCKNSAKGRGSPSPWGEFYSELQVSQHMAAALAELLLGSVNGMGVMDLLALR